MFCQVVGICTLMRKKYVVKSILFYTAAAIKQNPTLLLNSNIRNRKKKAFQAANETGNNLTMLMLCVDCI